MNLLDLLRPEHVVVPLEAANLRDAIEQLLDRLEASGAVEHSETLRRRVRSEPIRDVVGISQDVVLPHYRSDAVARVAVALGVSTLPIVPEDPTLEVRPRVVALILAPRESPELYLRAASTLARLLRQHGVVDALTRQTSPAQVLALAELQSLRIQPGLAVRDVMVHRVHTIAPDAPLRTAMNVMLRRGVRALPVVGPGGELLGILTEADLMRALLPQIPRADGDGAPEEGALDQPARDAMTRTVLCVAEDTGIGEVASMMINKDVEQVPVLHEGGISGIVTRGDIIRKLFGRF